VIKALALYESLGKYYEEFKLFYVCFDFETYDFLKERCLKNMEIIYIGEIEDIELLRVKNERSFAEYFYTCTAAIILFILEKYSIDICIYLDSDIYFFNSPEILLDEMRADESAMIIEHRFTRKHQSALVGKYCVQFMPFRNNENGKRILLWWKSACINWCFLKGENGLWADQGYLNDWPTRFEGIHELKHLGGGVAPWNVQQYKFSQSFENKIVGIEKATDLHFELVFYHFQGVRFYSNNIIYLGTPALTTDSIKFIYKEYINHIIRLHKEIKKINPQNDFLGILPVTDPFIRRTIRYIKRKINNRLITDKKFC
jgi:hypothetical protein